MRQRMARNQIYVLRGQRALKNSLLQLSHSVFSIVAVGQHKRTTTRLANGGAFTNVSAFECKGVYTHLNYLTIGMESHL